MSPPGCSRCASFVAGVATVIDNLIDRVMADDRLNANPRVDEARRRVSPAGFKYYVTEMACQAAGGPQQYSGARWTTRTAIS